MELIIVREHEVIPLKGIPDSYFRVYDTKGRKRNQVFLYKDSSRKKYVAGYCVGAMNLNDDEDLVVLPKIDRLDFVSMMADCLDGSLLERDRLAEIVFHFEGSRPVPLSGAPEGVREFLVLLFAELLLWIRLEGVSSVLDYLPEIGGFLRGDAAPYVMARLRDVFLDEAEVLLAGSNRAGEPCALTFTEEECGRIGVRGAAARAVRGLRALKAEKPFVYPMMVNMPLLFELFALHRLGRLGCFGDTPFYYQEECTAQGVKWFPDILHPGEGIVIDCKYKPGLCDVVERDDLRQICCYSYLRDVRSLIGNSPRMLFLYPVTEGGYEGGSLWNAGEDLEGFSCVRRAGIRLPQIETKE